MTALLTLHSGAQPDRYLLEEVRNGFDSEREVRQGRRKLYAELCGSVSGCEFYGY